ncbi:Nucleolar protein 9 [Hypoxylon texense]
MAAEAPGSISATGTYIQNGNDDVDAINVGANDFNKIRKSFGFWAIIIGLGITLWLAALENSVLTTAAPAILNDIPMGDNWVWLTNAFFLSSAAFQPLLGQLSNLFGRRLLTLGVVAMFIIGSGICGGANNSAQLIAGRAVQGIGSGGIGVALDTVVSDLVPLRYRGNHIAVILLIYSIRTTTGALIGGVIVDHITWRWCFWINLPMGGVSLAITFAFLHVHHRRDTHWIDRLKRVDVVGNAPACSSTHSCPHFQAPVPETDQGTATATWNFIRTMGSVWGVAIPAAIFGNRVDALVAAGAVSSDAAAASLVGGGSLRARHCRVCTVMALGRGAHRGPARVPPSATTESVPVRNSVL